MHCSEIQKSVAIFEGGGWGRGGCKSYSMDSLLLSKMGNKLKTNFDEIELVPGVNFTNILREAFFVQKFCV